MRLNHVLRVVLAVLVVEPGRQEEWTHTPTGDDTDRTVVTGGYESDGTTGPEDLTGPAETAFTTGTTTDLSTGRHVLYRHTDGTLGWTEGHLATEQGTQAGIVTSSWTSERTTDLSTDPADSSTEATTEVNITEWEDLPAPDHQQNFSPSEFLLEPRPWTVSEEAEMPQDSPDSGLRLGDTTASDTTASDTTASDTTASDTTASDTTASDTTASDTTASDTTASDTTASDTTASDTTASDTTASDTTASDTTASDTTASDTGTTGTSTGDHTDSTDISTTVTRFGERTLLSVTSPFSNSTSAMFTEDSNSHQPPSTWRVPARGTEMDDTTGRLPSVRPGDTGATVSDRWPANSSDDTFSKTDSPAMTSGTDALTGRPNVTDGEPDSTSEGTPRSTPPLSMTTAQEAADTVETTDQSEEGPASSTPPGLSSEGGPTNRTDVQGSSFSPDSTGTSTETSTGSLSPSTQSQGETEGVPTQTDKESTDVGLTMAPPTATTSMTSLDDSLARFLSGQSPFIHQTEMPALNTDVFPATTSVSISVTDRSQVTEEEEKETYGATTESSSAASTAPITTLWPPHPSIISSSSSSSSSRPTQTQPTTTSTTTTTTTATTTTTTSATTTTTAPTTPAPKTPASTPGQRTSTPATSHHLPGVQTQGPLTGAVSPTEGTTLRVETSTATLRGATVPAKRTTTTTTTTTAAATTTTTTTTSTTVRSTQATRTTGKHTDRGTTVQDATTPSMVVPPGDPCAAKPCLNGGRCVSYAGSEFICHCLQSWTGPTCNQDVDECEKDPCPPGSKCVNTRGSFSCECPLGFDLEDGRTCTRAKTFLGTFSINKMPHDTPLSKGAVMHELHRDIIQLLNASLSLLRGYSRSTLSKREEDGMHISSVNMFSTSTDVTSTEVYQSIHMSLGNCTPTSPYCRVILHHQLTFHAESLCKVQKTQCDTERSTCTDNSGTAYCQCLQGYYKHNPDDLSCIECGDGFKLENGTCVQCMFGFGGFNCGNFYKLIAVVVSPAGGTLLLILIIVIIVMCCKKDKNDINKIIFKSGDLQMSPYADFPKSNRVSMEWGRETIEMQENGSTKNLLQMTDIYYSPALRNSDLERNGLYPFTGLPGSRHSCIYPAQWNPSFISDDSRRRDYF